MGNGELMIGRKQLRPGVVVVRQREVVEDLHRFQQAERLIHVEHFTDLDERRIVRRGGDVKHTAAGRKDAQLVGVFDLDRLDVDHPPRGAVACFAAPEHLLHVSPPGEFGEEAGIVITLLEYPIVQDGLHQRQVGVHPLDLHMVEEIAQCLDDGVARTAGGDDLDDQTVIVRRNLVPFLHRADQTDVGPLGQPETGDFAGRSNEAVATVSYAHHALRVDTQLHGVALGGHLETGDGFPGRDADLLAHDVDAGDHLRHRVLHLQAGVHLHEVHLLRFAVEDELHRARADVIDIVGDGLSVAADRHLQLLGELVGGRFLDELLVVPLHGAVAHAEDARVSVPIAQQLHFHMAHRRDEFLEIDVSVAEGSAGLLAGAHELLAELGRIAHHAHTLSTAAEGRLDQHRVANLLGNGEGFAGIGHHALAAGHAADVELARGGDRIGLVAHQLHTARPRPDKIEAVPAAQQRKIRVLRKKADSRVNGIHLLLLGDADHAQAVEVAVRGRVSPQTHQAVLFAQQARRVAFHVRIGLHEHRLHTGGVGAVDQAHGGGAAGVNEHAAYRREGDVTGGQRFLLFSAEDGGRIVFALQGARYGFLDRLSGDGYGGIDLAQLFIQLGVERVLDQPLHAAFDLAEIVGQDRLSRQVTGHHPLSGEGNDGTGEVEGLDQAMGDKAGLGAAGAVAEAEAQDGQIEVFDEARDAAVQHRHGEQRPRSFLGLHAAGRDEEEDRQLVGGALDHQLAHLLSACHVEGTRLELCVADHDSHTAAEAPVSEIREARRDAHRLYLACQSPVDRLAEAREVDGVAGDQGLVDFLELGEYLIDHRPGCDRHALLLVGQQVLNQQVAVGLVQPVPEVLDADIARADFALETLFAPQRGIIRGQQMGEVVGEDAEQRLTQPREGHPLPFAHLAHQIFHIPPRYQMFQPGEKLRMVLWRGAGPGNDLYRAGGLLERLVQQVLHGGLGDLIGIPQLSGDQGQIFHQLVVEQIEQHQVLDDIGKVLPHRRHVQRLQDIDLPGRRDVR